MKTSSALDVHALELKALRAKVGFRISARVGVFRLSERVRVRVQVRVRARVRVRVRVRAFESDPLTTCVYMTSCHSTRRKTPES